MKRTIITVDDNEMLSISSNLANLWMSEGELVDMVLDLFLPKYCVHKDTARYVLSYSKPFELLLKEPAYRWIHLQSRVSGPTYR